MKRVLILMPEAATDADARLSRRLCPFKGPWWLLRMKMSVDIARKGWNDIRVPARRGRG